MEPVVLSNALGGSARAATVQRLAMSLDIVDRKVRKLPERLCFCVQRKQILFYVLYAGCGEQSLYAL